MRNLGVTEYNEYDMLVAMKGKCTNDGCYIVPIVQGVMSWDSI